MGDHIPMPSLEGSFIKVGSLQMALGREGKIQEGWARGRPQKAKTNSAV